MSEQNKQRATLNEVLALLKSRGISLSDEGIKQLAKRLEEEPVGKTTVEQGKSILENPLFKEILDRALVKRTDRIREIVEKNPLLKLIDEKRKQIRKEAHPEHVPMPELLMQVFYDEERWQPFFQSLIIPPSGQIIKVHETAHPDRSYIGYLHPEAGKTYLYTTRRKIDFEQMPGAKFFRLREGVFQYEIDEVKNLEKGYYEYIMKFHT